MLCYLPGEHRIGKIGKFGVGKHIQIVFHWNGRNTNFCLDYEVNTNIIYFLQLTQVETAFFRRVVADRCEYLSYPAKPLYANRQAHQHIRAGLRIQPPIHQRLLAQYISIRPTISLDLGVEDILHQQR